MRPVTDFSGADSLGVAVEKLCCAGEMGLPGMEQLMPQHTASPCMPGVCSPWLHAHCLWMCTVTSSPHPLCAQGHFQGCWLWGSGAQSDEGQDMVTNNRDSVI